MSFHSSLASCRLSVHMLNVSIKWECEMAMTTSIDMVLTPPYAVRFINKTNVIAQFRRIIYSIIVTVGRAHDFHSHYHYPNWQRDVRSASYFICGIDDYVSWRWCVISSNPLPAIRFKAPTLLFPSRCDRFRRRENPFTCVEGRQ